MSLLPPGAHGGDAHRLAHLLGRDPRDILDLSASLNPVAPDSTSVLTDALDELDRYPDDTVATRSLAQAMGVDPERLVLTNGGAEAIALVARRQPAGWADEMEFGLYRRHLATLDPDGPRWRSDPHNPTGRLLDDSDRDASVRDEAFFLLATGEWTRGDDETTVVGSLTKAWALPGLRIGYVLAVDEDEATAIRRLRPRWSVNGLVCAALPALLESAEPIRWRDGIATLRDQLVEVLRGHDIEPEPSDVNYVWVPHAPGLRERLLTERIVLRDGASFGHPDAVRIAVPDADGLERLARALDRVPPIT
ncbi:aminotransferase class I/II-fold pyridoxal phosphate-dependent enzyme [Actinospongicola halichondriae]|uniref:aminotransferase class I/II-fold pyridoxal phosphate-dependent enzyme n=1 Tax=Actinospongicola halichondriae TaxID=3236844 RepID=UPI003D4FB874